MSPEHAEAMQARGIGRRMLRALWLRLRVLFWSLVFPLSLGVLWFGARGVWLTFAHRDKDALGFALVAVMFSPAMIRGVIAAGLLWWDTVKEFWREDLR